MFKLSAGNLFVMMLLALIFLGPQKLPALAQRLRGRQGRRGFVQQAHEVPPMGALDWLLLVTGVALAFAVAALLAAH